MFHKIFLKWFRKCFRRKAPTEPDLQQNVGQAGLEYEFSPMTYKNPCIACLHTVLEQILKLRQIPYKKLELIIIDADAGLNEQDNSDIYFVLSQVSEKLNYLLLVTDRPEYYENFVYKMYEENGLIVQQLAKCDRQHARGNLILDFERAGDINAKAPICPGTIYLPVYKKPWEVGENLDIKVPVGYNTLVVSGIHMPQQEQLLSDYSSHWDRLEQEFRNG